MAAAVKHSVGDQWGFDVQRKVFRVEQMFAGGRATAAAAVAPEAQRPSGSDTSAVQDLKRELAVIRDAVARNKRDLGALIGDGKARKMARAAGELGAAVEGMEKATNKILKSAEVVDESAKTLTATLKDDFKRGLAQDIQDHVVHIYEACNFQDLAGQRIGNVIDMLNSVEQQVAAMLERCNDIGGKVLPAAKRVSKPVSKPAERALLNGPKLDGDSGHASQRDIDKIFG